MSNQGKSRKPLIIGIVAAVAVLAVLLALLLTQCVGGGQEATQSTPVQTTEEEVPTYELYWNLDRAEYDGKSEAGMSSRQQESDGYFHIRFFKDGETIELRAADRKVINAIDVNDIMGLEFDQNGIIIGVTSIDDMPLEQVGWQFYVQSVGGKLLKLNSSKAFNGLEVLLDIHDFTGIWDMTGMEGEVGMSIKPISGDRVIAIANLAGELTHVYVYDRPEYMRTFEAECQHCEKTVQWKMWTKTNELPKETGHYQLQNDISGMTVQQAIVEDGKVCIDLNGKTVDGKQNARVYTLHNSGAELAIMDTSEGQKGVLRGHSTSSDQGGVVWVRYGACYLYAGTLDASDMVSKLNGTAVEVPKNSFFYMYGGKIIGGTAKYQKNDKGNYTNGLGGAVSIRGKFVMYDGVIEGGTALGVITARNADGTPKTYQRGIGGNIYVQSGGVFEMHGGTIKNGTATHSGGNIYVDGTSEFTMHGGTITGGKVTGKGRNGGNVFITSKSTFTFNGGSIVNGVSYNCAANLYLNGKVIMNGGYIGKGTIYKWGTREKNLTSNSINVFNVNGNFQMYGGTIDGSVLATDTAADKTKTQVVLSGYATILAPEGAQYPSLTLNAGGDNITCRVGTLRDSAKIGVVASTGIFTLPTKEENVDNFYSEVTDAEICYVDGCIALGRFSCLCGNNDKGEHYGECDGTQLFWGPLTSTTMPKTTGNYYLPRVKDENGNLVPGTIDCKEQSSMVENAEIKLDLNGGTLYAKTGYRFFSLHNPGAYLVITDSSEGKTGVVKTSGEGTTQGNAVWVRYGRFDFYGGTLDGSGYQLYKSWDAGTDAIFGTDDDTEGDRKGGTVSMSGGTTFNMYGGTIIGNRMEGKELTKTVETTETVEGEEVVTETKVYRTVGTNGGASVYVPGKATFNMYAGEVRDGYSADRGGNLFIESSGTANLYGGVVKNGETTGWGGNVAMANTATLNIAGGTISGGKSAKNGGSIWTSGSGTMLRMTDGLIENGLTTGDQGGNIFCSGQMELLGGTVSGGRTNAKKNGGNIAINSSADVVLKGVTVKDGYSGASGGNVGLSTTNKTGTLVIGEGTVISGGEAVTNGGNLYVSPNNANKNDPNAYIRIEGGTIEGGKAAEGGNIYVGVSGAGESTLTITGGTITGGTATTGGNIRVAGAVVTVDGENVLIEKGTTVNSGHGGNVNTSGTFTLKNGTIRDGVAANTAGNIYANGSGKVIVEGGNILGGTDKNGANADESSIYVVCGTLELRGGYMDGGVYIINYANDNGVLKMSGNPVIKSETRNGLRFQYTGTGATHIPYIQIDEPMTEGAEIYINNTNWQVGKFSTETEEEYVKYFHAYDETRSIGYVDGCLALGKTNCVCGAPEGEHYGACDGEQLFWMPWASTSALPTTSGNYYIHPSVTVSLSSQWKPAEGAVINLDLNGRTVTCGARAVALNNAGVNVTVTDLSANRSGKIFKTGTYTGQGGLVWVTLGSTFNLYAGTIDGTGYVNGSNGGAVCVEGPSFFNMYGGTIKGTTSQTYGGNVAVKDTSIMTMTGGTIEGGKAFETGGNLFITGTAKVYISGGKIIDGVAGKDYVTDATNNGWGGNIELASSGYLQLTGDTEIGGGKTTGNGGNIRISSGTAVMEMTGGTVKNGQTADNGGNIFVAGSLTVTGGEIKDGKAKTGGNISANTAKTVSLSNITISGGEATSQGGNVRVFKNADATLNLTNVTLTGGKVPASKQTTANLDVTIGATVNITDSTIDGNASIASADADITLSGKVTITGSETNLTLGGAMLNLVDFSEESLVGINYAAGGYFTNTTEEKFKANFTSDDPNLFVDFVDGKMVLALGKYNCLCGKNAEPHDAGCDGTTHFWLPWNSSTTLPAETGYWYLTKDVVSLTDQVKITTAQDIYLDLNGKTVQNAEGSNIRFYWISADDCHITVTDTVGGGNMTNNGTYNQGMIAWVSIDHATKDPSFTLIKGKLDVSGASAGNHVAAPNAICLGSAKCTFTMYGGELLGGKTVNGGGAVYGENWDSRFNMYGGTITGHPEEEHAAVRLLGTKNVISGGTITGGVELNSMRFDSETTKSASQLTLSGSPSIDSILLTDINEVRATSGNYTILPLITVSGKLGNTKAIELSVLGDANHVFTANVVDAANVSKFTPATAGQSILVIEEGANAGKLYIGATKCLCGATDGKHTSYTDAEGNLIGCDGTPKPWMAWSSTSSLPTATGYWYLTDNVNYTTQASLSKNANVILDLNGKTVQAAQENGVDINARVYSVHNPGASLTITDSVGTGKMIASTERDDQGNVVWVRRDSTWGADDNIGTFILLGGTLQGNNPDASAKNGGVVNINQYGHFYMLGGTIQDGAANWGGNVMIDNNSVAYLVGGTVKNGTAKSGAGNVCIDAGSTVVIDGITIEGGETVGNGGNLYIDVDLELTIKNSTITGGQANGHGGNIYLAKGANVTITDSEIADGVVIRTGAGTAEGGNIKVDGATLTLNGTTVADGTGYALNADGTPNYGTSSDKKSWGGNIHVGNSGTLTINKGTVISGGYASGNGGNLNVSGTLNINGGEIKDGESKFDRGGNIWMGGSAKLNIAGGTITGGKAGGDRGGNIHANAGSTLSVTGGTISDGSVKDSKANISANINWDGGAGKVTFGGTANIAGGVYIRDAATVIEVSGKPVIFGGSTNLTPVNNITVGTLESGAKIGINHEVGVFTTNTVDASYADYFTSDKDNTEVAFVGEGSDKGKLAIGKVYAECGLTEEHDAHDFCDGELHTWVGIDALPGATGYYYLEDDLNITTSGQIKTLTTAAQVHLDFAGNSIIVKMTGTNSGRLYSTNYAADRLSAVSILFTNTSSEDASVVIDDASVEGNTVGDQGRIVWVVGANKTVDVYNVDFDLSGVEIRGSATQNGLMFATSQGNAGDASAKNVISIYNSEITGGNAAGGLINADNNTDVLLHDVTITGHTGSTSVGAVRVYSGNADIPGKLTLSGNTRVYGNRLSTGANANITIGANATLELTDSYKGSTTDPQGIEATSNTVILKDAAGTEGWFVADLDTKVIAYAADGMMLVFPNAENVYCICGSTTDEHANGCDGTLYVWTDWTATDSIPTAEGNYRLTAPINVTSQYPMAKDGTVRIDLNGQTVTDTSNRMITMSADNGSGNATLWITDTSEKQEGKLKLVHSEAYNGQGGIVWVADGSTLNLVAGTIDASEAESSKTDGGTAVCVAGEASAFNIYDGEVIGGKGVNGAAISVNAGTLSIYDGTVTGGTASAKGGSVYVSMGGTVNMSGGTVTGGESTSNGGNFYFVDNASYQCQFNMTGGTVSGGIATTNGGNIWFGQYNLMNLSGGTISGGKSGSNGGNIYLSGTLNVTGGTIKGGSNKNSTGNVSANMAITSVGVLNMTDGFVEGRIATTAASKSSAANLSGKAIISGGNALTLGNSLPVNIGKLEEGANLRFRLGSEVSYTLNAAEGYTLTADDVAYITAFYHLSVSGKYVSTEATITLDTANNCIVITYPEG